MNRLFSILLILTVAFRPLCYVVQLAHFQANKTYIVDNLCSNRSRPEMNCQASCYLVDQLNQTKSGDESQSTLALLGQVMSLLYCDSQLAIELPTLNPSKEETTDWHDLPNRHWRDIYQRLLKPPIS